MLYDRAVNDLAAAEDAMRRKDVATTGERIGRAQEILLELHSTLDITVWPERRGARPAVPVDRRRAHAGPAAAVAGADRATAAASLEPLRDAWHEAARGGAAAPAATGDGRREPRRSAMSSECDLTGWTATWTASTRS